jgi:hypothetical protein
LAERGLDFQDPRERNGAFDRVAVVHLLHDSVGPLRAFKELTVGSLASGDYPYQTTREYPR